MDRITNLVIWAVVYRLSEKYELTYFIILNQIDLGLLSK